MRRMHILLAVLVAVFVCAVGLLLTSPTNAQSGPIWLSFDGTSAPSDPSLALLSSSPTQIELAANLPGVYTEPLTVAGGSYTQLSGAGYGHPAAYGLPDLPVLRKEIEIPWGVKVSVEILSAEFTDNTLVSLGLNPILPLQLPVPKVEALEDDQPFTIDSKYYQNGLRYPSSMISLGEAYIVRGHRILPVEIWPVAYDASQASLRLVTQMNFRLNLTGADMAATHRLAERYSSPTFDAPLSERVLNYNQGRPLATNEQMGYLIIASDAYVDALAPFVTLKESRGFDVTLTPQSDIDGGNTATGIKAYIQAAYDTWPLPPSYVLLVGDTDTMPTWTGPEIGTSTDLYYGTMDGSSDWHPDIGRGRFPVRSAAQVTIMVDKYLAYADLTGQEAWIKTASFPATCDNYTVAEGTHNYVIDNHTEPGGWTGNFPEPANPGGDQLYCVTYDANQADVIGMASQGRWAIIYSGHGSYSGWELLDQSNVPNIVNYGMYPFVASHACLSGDFGQYEVFGETWVLQEGKGALVYWGSSTYSYWDEDDWLERAMFDSLFTDNGDEPHSDVASMTDAGLAWVEVNSPGMAKYYWETYNVLGDPSVHIFIEPESPTFTLGVDPTSHAVCTEGSVSSDITIGSVMNYSSTVYLENSVPPVNVDLTFDPEQAAAPYTSVLTLDVTPGALEGEHTLIITATDQVSLTQVVPLNLTINTAMPASPTLYNPVDGAIDQPFSPTFEWEQIDVIRGYDFELDDSPLFEAPLVSLPGLLAPTAIITETLDGGTCYWWRAQAENACGESAWAAPFHFSTINLGTSFSDDIETGGVQWSHAAAQGVDHWTITTAQSHSPTHAWFVPDDDITTDTRLWTSDPILVGEGSTLSFWHRYEFEGTSYDGSVLEISTDDGSSWTDLGAHITTNGYNGTISDGYNNPLAGRDGWTGELTTWTQVTVDLTSYAGEDVQIRWRLGCDSSVSATGWYIDDVLITAPLPPNPAPVLSAIEPDSGWIGEPTPVVITGEGLFGSPALKLGDTWLESVDLVDENTINAVVPAGLPAGLYDLEIYNGDCQSGLLPEAFTASAEQEPISGLSAASDSPTMLGDTTHFTATVEAGTGVIYTWSFGDGEAGNGAHPSHVYAEVGSFTAIVTATNNLGYLTATTLVTIEDVPISDLVATNDSPTMLGSTTTFTATLTTGSNVSFTWDFGDDSTGSSAVTTHTYTADGIYLAMVTATNSLGNATATTEVLVLIPPHVIYYRYLPVIVR